MSLGSKIKASLHGPTHTQNCYLVVEPDNPEHNGENLKALALAARAQYRNVFLMLDDVTCADTEHEACEKANAWLDRNRDIAEDYGISLEKMTRWSSMPHDPFYNAALMAIESLHKGSDDHAKKTLTSLAADNIEISIAGVTEMRGALQRVFKRIAGLARLSDYPTITSYNMPGDRNIFENAKDHTRFPNALTLPEIINVAFSEQEPSTQPAHKREPTKQSAQIIPFPSMKGPK